MTMTPLDSIEFFARPASVPGIRQMRLPSVEREIVAPASEYEAEETARREARSAVNAGRLF